MPYNTNQVQVYKLDLAKIDQPIDPGTLVAQKSDGEAVTFGQDIWDFTHIEGQKLSFIAWRSNNRVGPLADQITQDLKTLWWRWICTPRLGLRTTKKSWLSYQRVLNKLARMMYAVGTSLVGAENNVEFQSRLRISLINAHSDTTWTISYANTLKKVLAMCQQVTYELPADCTTQMRLLPSDAYDELVPILNRMTRVALASQNRTPLIPSRIYAALITSMRTEFEQLTPYLKRVESLAKILICEPRISSSKSVFREAKVRMQDAGYSVDVQNFQPSQVIPIVKVLDNTLGKERPEHPLLNPQNFADFRNHLCGLQKRCMAALLLFSGMRRHELAVIPFMGLERSTIANFGNINCVVSHTSKLNGGEYSEALRWVTDETGAQAITIAQTIARCFFSFKKSGPIPEGDLPLWLTRDWTLKPDAHYDYRRRGVEDLFQWDRNVARKEKHPLFLIEITQADIDELKAFDGLRDWADDPMFAVGKCWPLSSHQFRRSLAVYASRSGLVSLPDLAMQLKHLSELMTALYAENSAFAENFLTDENGAISGETHGVVKEFRAVNMLGLAHSFHRNVIEAGTPLTGGEGTRIEVQKDRGKLPKIYTDKKATERAMKEGRINYHETVVGGCMRKEICDAYGVDDILPCVFECRDAIIGGDGGKKLMHYAKGLPESVKPAPTLSLSPPASTF